MERFFGRAAQGTSLLMLADQSGSVDMLDEAIAMLRQGLSTMRPRGAAYATYLSNLAAALQMRSTWTGVPIADSGSIETGRQAVAAMPARYRLRPLALSNLADALWRRYDQSGERADLDEAADLAGQALSLARRHDGNLPRFLAVRGKVLLSSYEWTKDPADLETALDATQRALDLTPPQHPRYATTVDLAGAVRKELWRATGQTRFLDDCIELRRAAAASTGADHPEHYIWRANVAEALGERYARLGDDRDVTEAIDLLQADIRQAPAAGYLSYALRVLGQTYRLRYEASGSVGDLAAAATALRDGLDAAAPADPERAGLEMELCQVLLLRHERDGDRRIVDEAVARARRAAAGLPVDRLDGAMCTLALSRALLARFQHHYDTSDLEQAATLTGSVFDAMPADGQNGPVLMANGLAVANTLIGFTRDRGWLAVATRLADTALAATPAAHPARVLVANNSGLLYRHRYLLDADAAALDRAETLLREAARPDQPAPRHGYVPLNLALTLMDVSSAHGDTRPLVEAVAMLREMRSARSGGPADRMVTANLAVALSRLHEHRPDLPGDEVLELLRETATDDAAPPLHRVEMSAFWGRLAFRRGRLDASLDGYGNGVRLLPRLAWRGLGRTSRERLLSLSPDVVGDACAVAVAAARPQLAADLIEQGRAVLWSQVLESRAAMTDLRAAAPRLAARLSSLAATLEEPGR
ncbi:hypothetical protein GCM10010112_70430 [Actinoplanes lobatus]|uniref:Tetratricopeptide repeat protein n=1 Tax=Actinoplanes lobatus TaxID=113568 RepID=A0ABQ4AF04_9ACTN|nr:hypothetical protein GCM10010112_70430 [Actinoplanes lobatus]GIE39587.1 hypothetical protein Alo02nite_24850 [Actinoplanes lobatus]